MHVVLHPPMLHTKISTSVGGCLCPSSLRPRMTLSDTVTHSMDSAIAEIESTAHPQSSLEEINEPNQTIVSVTAERSQLGDEGVQVFCEIFRCKYSLHFKSLEVLNLSFCSITVRGWSLLHPLLNDTELPSLKALHLVGNFRRDFGVDCYAHSSRREKIDLLATFVSDVARTWLDHRTLHTLTIDPWLETAAFQDAKMSKLQRKREDAVRSFQLQPQRASPGFRSSVANVRGLAARASMLRGTVDRTHRGSVFEISQGRVSQSLFDAAHRTQSDVTSEKFGSRNDAGEGNDELDVGAAASQKALVELQLLEHRKREKVQRLEESSRVHILGESGVHMERMMRSRSHRVKAMEELEDEVRTMLFQREADSRRKIYARW